MDFNATLPSTHLLLFPSLDDTRISIIYIFIRLSMFPSSVPVGIIGRLKVFDIRMWVFGPDLDANATFHMGSLFDAISSRLSFEATFYPLINAFLAQNDTTTMVVERKPTRKQASFSVRTALLTGLIVGFTAGRISVGNLPCPTRTPSPAPTTAALKEPLMTKAECLESLQATTVAETRTPEVKEEEKENKGKDEGDTLERNFLEIGKRMGTDKVAANLRLGPCLRKPDRCTRPGCAKEECRPWGHFYNTLYQQRFGSWSRNDTEPFQFLEIGFYHGKGFETYLEFFPRAEAHSMEISCLEHGPPSEGKWPFGNFAAENEKWYDRLRREDRLHCGDANKVEFLNKTWIESMKRPDAPPLRMVVDDGAHVAAHMAQTVFFWFPRIAPHGFLIVEDVQPIPEANRFRTQFLPQIMSDLHYCGDPALADEPCFPTLQPLLASIHCEMHICIFGRNGKKARELSLRESTMPPGALDLTTCKSLQLGKK